MRIGLAKKIKRSKQNIMKTSATFVIPKFLSDGTLNDEDWLIYVLLSITGLIIFDLIIYDYIDDLDINGDVKKALLTIGGLGCMYIVSKLFTDRTLADEQWIKKSIVAIFGYSLWSGYLYKYIDTTKLSHNAALIANDILASITIYLTIILFGDADSIGSEIVIYDAIAFIIYDLFIDGLI